MTGTLGGALEARGIPASEGRLVADVRGEVGLTEDGVLRIERIHVGYRLRIDGLATLDDGTRAKIDRALRLHGRKCPIHRSIGDRIPFTTELELVEA